ncbi:MAG TPA: hypothetical protein PLU35_03980 [Phycisphaerales bacterium]|nr:hypothetical protein [Phycisphaerales bacterium]
MHANRTTRTSTHAGRAFRSALCVLAVMCAVVRAAAADPPVGALAWVAVEAKERGLERPRPEMSGPRPGAWIDAIVHATLPARTPASDAVVGVVGRALAEGLRVEVVLLDFAAGPGPRDGTADVLRFSLVVRVEGGAFEALRGVVREAFPGAPAGASSFTADGAPAWQTVAFTEREGAFLLGVGVDALAAWERAAASGAEPAWAIHRAALGSHQAGAAAVASAFIDANALRRAFPESFASGRLGRVAHAWGIANARSLMVRAAASPRADAPPALLIDGAFEARSRPPGSVVVEPIVGASWPGGASALAGEGGAWASAVPAAWSRAHEWALRTWEASRDGWGTIEFDARRARWERQHVPRLQRLFGSTGPWAIVAGGRLVVPLGPDADPSRVAADLAALFATFGDRAAVSDDGLSGSIRVGPAPGAAARWSVRREPRSAVVVEFGE